VGAYTLIPCDVIIVIPVPMGTPIPLIMIVPTRLTVTLKLFDLI